MLKEKIMSGERIKKKANFFVLLICDERWKIGFKLHIIGEICALNNAGKMLLNRYRDENNNEKRHKMGCTEIIGEKIKRCETRELVN